MLAFLVIQRLPTQRYLVNIINDNALATGAVGLRIQQDSTAPALVALGNVGIGTDAPVGRLEVSENSGTTAGVTKLRITARTQGAYDGDAHLEFAYNDWGNVNVPNLLASIQGLASVAAPSNVGGGACFCH